MISVYLVAIALSAFTLSLDHMPRMKLRYRIEGLEVPLEDDLLAASPTYEVLPRRSVLMTRSLSHARQLWWCASLRILG